MTKLSVVIPVFNALESLKTTLVSLVENSSHLYEIIIVDDYSEEPTRAFIDTLRIEDRFNCRLIKTRNPSHLWTNASWNMGVSLAHGDYIAILNSDITVSPGWDKALIELAQEKTIACPYEKKRDGSLERLDPVIEKVDPNMLKGACFLFSAEYKGWLFPIPDNLTHWCGDNYLADAANSITGVGFTDKAMITHGITKSGRLIDPAVYKKICKGDVLAYQEMSGRDMSLVLRNFD